MIYEDYTPKDSEIESAVARAAESLAGVEQTL